MARYVYPAVFTKGGVGLYSVSFPDLEGCNVKGKRLYEAMQMAMAVGSRFGVSPEWLLTGEGEAFPVSADKVTDSPVRHNSLDGMEEVLIREYMQLNDGERDVFRKFIKNIIREIAAEESVNAETDGVSIDEKVAMYRAELEAQAALQKGGF